MDRFKFSDYANTFWRLQSEDGGKWYITCSYTNRNGRATIYMNAKEDDIQLGSCPYQGYEHMQAEFMKHSYRAFANQDATDAKLSSNCPVGQVYNDPCSCTSIWSQYLETEDDAGRWEIGNVILSAVDKLIGVAEEQIATIER
eukprot:1109161-Pyramimonas_sp.AAC.1